MTAAFPDQAGFLVGGDDAGDLFRQLTDRHWHRECDDFLVRSQNTVWPPRPAEVDDARAAIR